MTTRTRAIAIIAALALALGGALLAAGPANAATFTVTDPGDSGPGTLRQAILDANALAGPDNITFALAGPSPHIITLATVLPDIVTDLTITGLGEADLIIDSPGTVLTITGPGPRVVVSITDLALRSTAASACGISASQVTLTVSRVTASNLDCVGINVSDGSLTATDVKVQGDTAGGIGFTGNAATDNLTLTRVNADNAGFKGVDVLVTGGTATLSDVQANTSGSFGIVVEARASAVVTMSKILVDGTASGYGVSLLAKTGSSITASQVTSTNNGASGMYVTATGGSSVALSTLTITRNSSGDDGGGIDVESVTGNGASVTISDSTISNNTSVDFGGGLYLHNIGSGTSTAHVVVQRTTFDHNDAGGYGGAIAIDGVAPATSGLPTVLVDSSTMSSNTSPYGGGGLHVRNPSGPTAPLVELLNSTITSNDAQAGGGFDASGSPMTVTISHSTIANNSAHTSGGVAASPNTLQIDNSIISGATSNNGNTPDDLDVGGAFTAKYSIIQSPRAGVIVPAGFGNLTGVDPLLAPLANNGGTTKTMLITPGSPAYDSGDPAFTGAGLVDQRGQARVFQVVDMGAVEWHPALALTGGAPRPETPLIALLLLSTGLALVAASRIRRAA
ncbi:hypothetical protein BH11ACT4_BH11ACT4_01190 [soil metagenome]